MVDTTDLWTNGRSPDGETLNPSIIEQIDALMAPRAQAPPAAQPDLRETWGMGPEAEAGQHAMMNL